METLLEATPDDLNSNDEDWNDPNNDWIQEMLKTSRSARLPGLPT